MKTLSLATSILPAWCWLYSRYSNTTTSERLILTLYQWPTTQTQWDMCPSWTMQHSVQWGEEGEEMAWGFSNNNHEQSVLHKIKYIVQHKILRAVNFAEFTVSFQNKKNISVKKKRQLFIWLKLFMLAIHKFYFRKILTKNCENYSPQNICACTIDNIITIYEEWDWQKKK